MLHMIFSQCSLQRPSVLRMNTMTSSTEGSRGYCWSARDNKSSCCRQTIVRTRQWCHNISLHPKSVMLQWQHQAVWISCRTFLLLLFVCLSWCKLKRMAHRVRVQTLVSSGVLLPFLVVSWLFGTLTVKANVFFVHRYWFIQLFLSKCFYSAVLLFLSELTRHYSEVLCTLTLSCRDTNKAKNTV